VGQRAGMTQPSVIANVTCLGCGCTCDDIDAVVASGRIVEARNACQLGLRWFGDGQVPANIRVDGADVGVDQAMSSAVARLCEADRPLVYIAPGLSCESQREAVAVADLLRARLDSVPTSAALPFTLTSQEHGYAAATLGELRNRADVLVFWGIDLLERYPRFSTRYAPNPAGTHVPEGRRSRTVIAVDVGSARASIDADVRITVDPADELATLTALEAVTRSPDTASRYASFPHRAWVVARELAVALLSARYIALVYDAEPDDRSERTTVRFEALASLAQALNDRTRCAALALRGGGNRSGADAVLVAQTGYPCAVDFARGYPRYDPHASVLRDPGAHGIDAALVVGDPTGIPSEVSRSLAGLDTVVIGPRASTLTLGERRVVIDTGADGIHASGTALRTDDVPLPLRASLGGRRSTAETIRGVTSGIRRLLLLGHAAASAGSEALGT